MQRKNGYQHMVLDHLVSRIRQIHRERDERMGQIETADQARGYQREVQEAIQLAFSPRPPKTPLNAEVTGIVGLDAFHIEKVTFESRPGCLVTANLYVPRDLDGPAPCVLAPCGHSANGKALGLYQAFCQRLAHAGFVVLIYDPYNQGERDQYHGLPERKEIGGGTRAHNMMGKQLELLGEFFGMWRAWDGVRALDYLLSRPEVDATRVGLTGNSGGGTMSTWLWAIEGRFTMAAPSCFVTTFLHDLENELPGDAEQCPPGVLARGLEQADFLIAAAPKPVLLLGQRHDYFDRRGLQDAYRDVSRFYDVMGAPADSTRLFIGPEGHGYSVHNQQAMVAFFCQHAGLPAKQVDVVETLEEGVLNATSEGNVIAAGGRRITEWIGERARQLAEERGSPDAERLRGELRRLLALPQEARPAYYRVLRPAHHDDAAFARYAVETEGSIRAILWKRLAQPEYAHSLDVEPEVHLYLPHVSSQVDLTTDALALSLGASQPLYALDVRGLGESMPEEAGGSFFQSYGMDYMFHVYGLMLGQTYLGRRVYDLLRTMDLLAHEGAKTFYLYGRGQGALLALFAALFRERVTSVTLKNAPMSFGEWTQTPLVRWPAANFVRGILDVCDLPDCMRVLGDRLQIVEPWGPDMEPGDSLQERAANLQL